jgi:hypothetical protein
LALAVLCCLAFQNNRLGLQQFRPVPEGRSARDLGQKLAFLLGVRIAKKHSIEQVRQQDIQ